MSEYVARTYRMSMEPEGLTCYAVKIKASDLYICTVGNLHGEAFQSLKVHREELENYLAKHPFFGVSFKPVPLAGNAPLIVREMASASKIFGVGPMACVAGAIAEQVGKDLLPYSPDLIVENGGDLFLAGGKPRKVKIFAGEKSPPIEIAIEDSPEGVGLCTSSASVGPSISLGLADAVSVLATSSTIADAAATYFGNMVRSVEDIGKVLELASRRKEVEGILVAIEGSVGIWGKIELLGFGR